MTISQIFCSYFQSIVLLVNAVNFIQGIKYSKTSGHNFVTLNVTWLHLFV